RRAGALSVGLLGWGYSLAVRRGGVNVSGDRAVDAHFRRGAANMPIEKWSDRIGIVHLSADAHHLGDDLQSAQEQLAGDGVDIVLDFAGVKYLNSSHIARLLKLRKAVSSAGNRLVLCSVDTQV